MGTTPLDVIVSGLALGGVLAVAAAWSRAVRGGGLPHLGVGATAGFGVMLANRLGTLPAGVAVLVVLLAGAATGGLAASLDRRVRGSEARWPARPAVPPVLADVAALGALLALAAALRPPLAIPVPFGPLGGRPGSTGALVAVAAGAAGVWLVLRAGPGSGPVWWVAGAATALAAAGAGGAVGPAGATLVALPTAVDAAGLAFRAAAAALLGRQGPLQAAGAGLALGLAEGLLWLVAPTGLLGAVPAVLAAGTGIVLARTPVARLKALGP